MATEITQSIIKSRMINLEKINHYGSFLMFMPSWNFVTKRTDHFGNVMQCFTMPQNDLRLGYCIFKNKLKNMKGVELLLLVG